MTEDKIYDLLKTFEPISLEGLDKVEFMSRVDTKFLFPLCKLPDLLQIMKNDYMVLQIDGIRCFDYETTYYDDDDFSMYYSHHNKSLNRYKVRHRTYLNTHKSFLEVKFKTNKRRTVKKRKSCPECGMDHEFFDKFISKTTCFEPDSLKEKLTNTFTRITLVNKRFTERLTIDFHLSFITNDGKKLLHYLCIAEIKNDRKYTDSQFYELAKPFGIRKSGFSKYSVGCSVMFPGLKVNRFKKIHLQLKKFEDVTASTN